MGLLSQARKNPASFAAAAAAETASWLADVPAMLSPAGMDDEPAAPATPPPDAAPEPCGACGSPFFWQDLGGQVHCRWCVEIPSRRMVRELWQVIWSPADSTACWAVWHCDLTRSDILAHLVAEPAAPVDVPEGF